MQTFPSQQPWLQLEKEQPALQTPALQLVPPEHCWHAAPLRPQVASTWPGMHLSPWQQPVHEVVVQVHLPVTQPWVELQAEQAAPPVPQAAGVLPGWHWPLASQQPLAQLLASQVVVVGLQTPAEHTSLSWQALHWPPPVPQLDSLFPVAQLPLGSQQPLAQLLGPQTTAAQA